MRLSSAVILLIVIAGIFAMFAISVRETNEQYSDVNISSSEWESKYDYSQAVQARANNLSSYLTQITDPDKGFFSKLALGIDAIPYAVIAVPSIILESMGNGISIAVSALTALKIDSKIIILITIAIIIWGVFKLVGMFSRSDV
jgi:hypothetical protein